MAERWRSRGCAGRSKTISRYTRRALHLSAANLCAIASKSHSGDKKCEEICIVFVLTLCNFQGLLFYYDFLKTFFLITERIQQSFLKRAWLQNLPLIAKLLYLSPGNRVSGFDISL